MLSRYSSFFISILLVCILPIFQIHAEEKQRFNVVSMEDGLPHTDVNDIVQDTSGYIWMATYAGLCKWDGYRMTVFNKSNSELLTDRILTLEATSSGLLFIGTEEGGLYVMNTNTHEFIPITPNDFFKGQRVFDLLELDDNSVCVCHNNMLSIVSVESDKITFDTILTLEQNQHVVSVIKKQKNLLVGTEQKIYIVDSKVHTARMLVNSPVLTYASCMSELSDSLVVIGTPNGVFNLNTNTAELVKKNTIPCQAMIREETENLWAGSLRQGLYKCSPDGGEIICHYNVDPFKEYMLTSSEITSLFIDYSNTLWIGTIGGGANILNLQPNSFQLYTVTEGLSDNRILTFGQDSLDRNLWVSTYSGGVDIFNLSNGEFHPLTINGKSGIELPKIYSFYVDPSNNIWLGTERRGLFCIKNTELNNISQKKYDVIAKHYNDKMLDNKRIFTISPDNDNLWLSTDNGLIQFCLRDNTYQSFNYSPVDYYSLSSDSITDLLFTHVDGFKRVWVATRKGLNMGVFNDKNQITWYRIDLGNDYKENFISCLHQDKKGNLYVAVLGEGLYKISLHQKSYTNIKSEKVSNSECFFKNNQIETITEDNSGNLWLGGNGLCKYYPETETYVNYYEKHNLQSNTFNTYAVLKLFNGNLVFGGPAGFNIFKPENVSFTQSRPRTSVFQDIIINEKNVPIKNKYELNYNENNIEVSFSSLSFTNPKLNVYKYKLDGLDKDWLEVNGENPKCRYTNIPSGVYRLEVYGSNSDGVFSNEPAVIDFKIKTHPLLSKGAFVIYFLLFICFIYLLYRYTTNRAREKARRKAEYDKMNFFIDMAHEIKTPLSLILSPIEELLANPAIGSVTRSRLELMQKSVLRLKNIVTQGLDLKKYDDNKMSLHVTEIDMNEFLLETSELFTPLADSKNINFKVNLSSDKQMVYVDIKKMEMAVSNLLSNSFKYTNTNHGSVVLESHGDTKNFYFSIEDNGMGISSEEVRKIFDRFYQGDSGIAKGGTGIGLSLTKYIIEHHHGNIKVDSRVNFGSKFTVTLPKGSSCFKTEEITSNISDADNLVNYDSNLTDLEQGLEDINLEKSATILVVDDNDDLRKYMHDVLSKKYNVLVASNGMSAYELAIAEQPDLILSDIVMPEMTGIELCKRIKNNEATSHIIVVLLTARNLVSTELEVWDVGADAFITKPFHVSTLLSRISNLILSRDNLRKAYNSLIDVSPSDVKIVSADEKLIIKCVESIEKNMSDPDFTVEQLSLDVGMSRAQLYRKMKALTGMSTVDFIKSTRLKRAAQMLEQDGTSVSTVMYAVGFTNSSYFSKIFKQQFGLLPKEYHSRRNCQNMND